MNELPDWVARINQKKRIRDPGDTLVTNLFYLMKELHVSYEELCDMPIPTIIVLIEEMQEHARKEEREAKKASRKR